MAYLLSSFIGVTGGPVVIVQTTGHTHLWLHPPRTGTIDNFVKIVLGFLVHIVNKFTTCLNFPFHLAWMEGKPGSGELTRKSWGSDAYQTNKQWVYQWAGYRALGSFNGATRLTFDLGHSLASLPVVWWPWPWNIYRQMLTISLTLIS